MKLYRNLKIGTRIFLGVLIVVILVAGSFITVISVMNNLIKSSQEIIEVKAPNRQLAGDIAGQFLTTQLSVSRFLDTHDTIYLDSYNADTQKLQQLLDQAEQDFKNTPYEEDILKIGQDIQTYQTTFSQIQELIISRQTQMDETLNIEGSKISNYLDDLQVSGYITGNLDIVNQISLINMSVSNMRQDISAYFYNGDEDKAVRVDQFAAKSLSTLDWLDTSGKLNAIQKEKVQTTQKSLEAFVDSFNQIHQAYQQETDLVNNTLEILGGEIRTTTSHISSAMGDDFLTVSNHYKTSSRNIQIMYILTTLGAVILALVFASLITRQIVAPFLKVVKVAHQITEVDLKTLETEMNLMAKGDLTRKIEIATEALSVNSDDEVGRLAGAFNAILASLKSTGNAFNAMSLSLSQSMSRITDNAQELLTASHLFAESAEQSNLATGQITETFQQVAHGMSEQNDGVAKTMASIDQLGQVIEGVARGARDQASTINQTSLIMSNLTGMIQKVANNAQLAKTDSLDAAKSTRDGVNAVEKTIEDIQSIKTAVDYSAQKVKEMGERSEKIGQIVETIQDIASQTNLLALNAAIEAARAGEQGKGFAVVADEVRKLAERSSIATKEIATLVSTIRKSVSEAMSAMNKGSQEVENGVQQAASSGEVLSRISNTFEQLVKQSGQTAGAAQEMLKISSELVSSIDSLSAVVEENTAATEEMTASASEVSQAMSQIAAISGQTSASVEEVSAATEQINNQAEQVSHSIQSLESMAEQLQEVSSQFKVN